MLDPLISASFKDIDWRKLGISFVFVEVYGDMSFSVSCVNEKITVANK